MLHGLEMVFVMIAPILLNAILMVVIAVEAMSICNIAQTANVIGQAHHMFSHFLNLTKGQIISKANFEDFI